MNIDLHNLFLELPSDKDFANIVIFLEELASEFRQQHFSKIKRYYKEVEEAMKESQEMSANWDPNNNYPF